jgi:hypothetical protein
MRIWKSSMKMYAAAISLCFSLTLAAGPATRAQAPPIYKVDPFWPKRLPHNWSTQQFVDIYVSKNDHIWAINRSVDARPDELGAMKKPAQGECCVLGPEILEFDTAGNVLKAWGKDNYAPGWPGRLQTMTVDREENVWLSGTRPGDGIIKFSSDGKLLWDFGHRGPKVPADQVKQNNQQTDTFFGGIEAFDLDEGAHEIYITDSAPDKRVLVYDMNTGAFKRGWGGHGAPLKEIANDPPPPYDISGPPPDLKQFVPTLHCIHIAVDGLVYVCERGSDRVQVFTKQGKFVTSFFVHPSTPARGPTCGGIWHATLPMCGTVFNMTFSHDPKEKYLLVADGTNDTVWILNRSDGKQVGSFGGNGRYAGQLHWIDAIAMDSKGNVYTGEVEDGKRIQKFILTNGDGKSTQPHPTTSYK